MAMSGFLKQLIRAIGLAGFAIFGILFAATYLSADSVERLGQTFIKFQVEKEVRKTYDGMADSSYGSALGQLKDRYEEETRQIQDALNNRLSQRIADVIAIMCRLDCEKREGLRQSIESGYRSRLIGASGAMNAITELIKGKYLNIVSNLTRDIRIFLGGNALLFLVVAALAFLKPRAGIQLYLPAGFLLISTVVCSGIYLFWQNWFFTIIYNDYVGFGYVVYVGVQFAFLCDIAFNKARVSTAIVNTAVEAIGSAIRAVPC